MGNRRSLFFALFLLVLLSLLDETYAGEVSFLRALGLAENALWLIDPNTIEDYGQVGYFPPDSAWHIVQWGILSLLPVKTKRLGNGWMTRNKDARVWVYPDKANGGYVADLKQNSKNPGYGATEFDLFLEPNHFVYPDLPQSLMHYDDQASLSSFSTVRMKARQELITAWHGTRGVELTGLPGMDYASTLLAIVMINPYTSPEQLLFYEIITYDSRDYFFDMFWFDQGTWSDPYMTYGVDDSVEIYGEASLTRKKPKSYDLNVAARLKDIVLAGPPSLDKNLDHWKVAGGLYFGSILNGEATIRSRIRFIDFTYEK